MDELQKQFSELAGQVAEQMEGVLCDLTQGVDDLLETVTVVSEEISTQLQTLFADEVEQYVAEFVSPVLEAYLGLGMVIEEASQPIVQTVDPFLKQHPACSGCRHFHGQVYGDHLLVCAMHPYGAGEGVSDCPDKEPTAWSLG